MPAVLCCALLATYSAALDPLTTEYDGITRDLFVSYIELNEDSEVKVPIADSGSEDELRYSIMMWMKPTSESFGNSLQYAFVISKSLQCYFSASADLICESFEKCEKLSVSVDDVSPGRWIHIALGGHPIAD
jgi:hypothetical protein